MLYGKSNAANTQHGLVADNENLIMLVAPRSTLFQGLAHALDEHIDGCRISLGAATDVASSPSDSLQLVLLYIGRDCDTRSTVSAWRRRLGDTPIAIIVHDMASVCDEVEQMLQDGQLQGILPLTLNLEVWLSVVMLLLHGGEYLPIRHGELHEESDTSPMQPFEQETDARPDGDDIADMELAPAPELAKLTHREQEVLELLSQGYQNKLIAHRMALSQHTVKVHVHNLLAKLRVTNRTQAAAKFRQSAPRPRHTALRDVDESEERYAR
ncbi:response regulator transcription factor [Nitratireductor basaltis]|uniref:Response regulator containing a CheY-like receiver domain and an HTH DNA-binding domain protein n=1 Tax=Nitratireductor basaltis TaxID=472175 RepID=A0A084U8H5_9HYPH|nr:response regulator transcription factor [Nitratireductor basaltis]KFB09261.1 Response regulator containing a CheY-like receiver domain and an HTH DNA-binding domain protein [Nitratireductor basaltis]